MIIFLYGPPGSGKTYIGDWLQSEYGYYFYDADFDLTEDMKINLCKKKPFTPVMRENFFSIIIKKMSRLSTHYPQLVVAQACSQMVNRKQIQKVFPHASFIHVNVDYDIRVKRLTERNDWITSNWIDELLDIQEPANKEHFQLDNSRGRHHLVQQFKKWGLLLHNSEIVM